MHLKSLTLRGFKSFASATTLRLRARASPAVVGPNGSGKSNVVDAIAWVHGRAGRQEPARRQDGGRHLRRHRRPRRRWAGPRSRSPSTTPTARCRSTTPRSRSPADDVPLRRLASTRSTATAVPPARRPGAARPTPASAARCTSSSARASSTPSCPAAPEDRRGFIEEAAGVLKHRKRKEKALRKLDGDAGQPRPARRPHRRAAPPAQAAGPAGRGGPPRRRGPGRPARRPAAPARRRPGRSCATPWSRRSPTRPRCASGAPQVEARAGRRPRRARPRWRPSWRADRAARSPAPRTPGTACPALRERFRGTGQLAAERLRHLAAEPDRDARAGPRPRRARGRGRAGPRARSSSSPPSVDADRAALAAAVARARGRRGRRSGRGGAPCVAGSARAAADRREGLARLSGQVAARALPARGRASAEIDRLSAALAEAARARPRRPQRDFTALETQVAGLDEGEVGLDAEHEAAAAALAAAERRSPRCDRAEQ